MRTWKDDVGVPNTLCNTQELADCLMHLKYDCLDTWRPNIVTSEGMCVIPSIPNRFAYQCTSGGTTGATEPNWSLLELGDTVTDGTVIWQCVTKAGGGGTSSRGYGEMEWLTTGTYTWTSPSWANKVSVELGAAGGGGSRGWIEAGAGGGCGEYKPSTKFTITPDTNYTVTVGSPGQGSTSRSASGTTGGISSFGALISCAGGVGGMREDAGGDPTGGAAGGGLFAVDGAGSFIVENIKYAGCGGDLKPSSGRVGNGGGKLSATLLISNATVLLNVLREMAGNYSPITNGEDAVGVCAGGGGGPAIFTTSRGGHGAPGFVKIRFWNE